tara:strand:- start:6590 stop:7534 length:945 start_codon:yes stop_codon:yes gene_type:complete
MKITYIFDETYISQFLTVTNSIISNEKPYLKDSISFYINYFGSQQDVEKIMTLSKNHFPNNQFFIKHIPSEFPDLFKKQEKAYDFDSAAQQIQTSSVYCRFYLDKIWEELDGVILHLDLDLIVKNNISNLFSSLSRDACFSACPNFYLNQHILPNFLKSINKIYNDNIDLFKIYKEQKDLISIRKFNLQSPSFNAGVWAVNLNRYRNENIGKLAEFLMMIHSFEKIVGHNDEGILNSIFYKTYQPLDKNWNSLHYGCDFKWANSVNLSRELNSKFEGSYIIHYNGPNKPWSFSNPQDHYFPRGIELWKRYEIKT